MMCMLRSMLIPALATVGPATTSSKPTRQFIMMPMRDGVRLATDIWYPRGRGPWPVVLIRTPYGRPDELDWEAKRLLDHGYVIVIQNLRGVGKSEGEALVFHADAWGEHPDGYDCVEWIARQPWCTGKIGTWGKSGPGITQYMLAGTAPPHLTCQHIGLAACDLYSQAVFEGGAYREHMVDNWLKNTGFDLEAYRRELLGRYRYDDLFAKVNLAERFEKVNSPILHWNGWFDCFAQAAIDAFVDIQHKGGPKARGKQLLIMGPWPHGIAKDFGQVHLPQNALLPPHIDALEWFDWWLKGKPPKEKPAPVYYYTVGDLFGGEGPGNEWRSAPDWPVPATPTRLFLTGDRQLALVAPKGTPARIRYQHDPKNPVPTWGGRNLFLDKGPFDQRELEARPDVVTFTTPVLKRPLEVTGRVTATLWISSSAPDTDFVAKLSDVYPDGKSMQLLDGIITTRFRESFRTPTLMTPGKVYRVRIDLWSISVIFNAGHRIRLAICSSSYPRFRVNPNTGLPPLAEQTPLVATNTIYCGQEFPSHVELPVVGPGPAW